MTTVNVHEAKAHLSRLLERVRAGEEIVISKAGNLALAWRGWSRGPSVCSDGIAIVTATCRTRCSNR